MELKHGWEIFHSDEPIGENPQETLSKAQWVPIKSPSLRGDSIKGKFTYLRVRLPNELKNFNKMSLYMSGFGSPFSVFYGGKLIYQFKKVDGSYQFFHFPWHLIELPEHAEKYIYFYTSLPQKTPTQTGFEMPIHIIPTVDAYFQIAKTNVYQGIIGLFLLALGIMTLIFYVRLTDSSLLLNFTLMSISLGLLLISEPFGPPVKQLIHNDPKFWGTIYQANRILFPIFLIQFYLNIFNGTDNPFFWALNHKVYHYISLSWIIPLIAAIFGVTKFQSYLSIHASYCFIPLILIWLDRSISFQTSTEVQKIFSLGLYLFALFLVFALLCSGGLMPNKWESKPFLVLAAISLILAALAATLKLTAEIKMSNLSLSHTNNTRGLIIHENNKIYSKILKRIDLTIHSSEGMEYHDCLKAHLTPVNKLIDIVKGRNNETLTLKQERNLTSFSLSQSIKDNIETVFILETCSPVDFEYNLNHRFMIANLKRPVDDLLFNFIENAKNAINKSGRGSKNRKISFFSDIEWIGNRRFVVLSIRNSNSALTEEFKKNIFNKTVASTDGNGVGLFFLKYNIEKILNGKVMQPESNELEKFVQFTVKFPTYSEELDSMTTSLPASSDQIKV